MTWSQKEHLSLLACSGGQAAKTGSASEGHTLSCQQQWPAASVDIDCSFFLRMSQSFDHSMPYSRVRQPTV